MLRMLTSKAWGAMALGAVVMLTGPAWVSDAAGTWNVEIDTPEQVYEDTWVIADDLQGKLVNEQVELELQNVKFEDGKLSFDYTVQFEGGELHVEVEGTIDGDTITGNVFTNFGDAPLTGSRVVTLTPVGTWNYVVEVPGGALERMLIITKDMKGRIIADNGEIEVNDITLEGTTLTFFYTVELGGDELDVDFKGEIDGDKFTGGVSTDMGDMPASGSRAPATSLAGSWAIEISTPEDVLEYSLVVTDDMAIKIVTPDGDWIARDVALDGEKLTFLMTVTYQGESLETEFSGTATGNGIEGTFYTDEGQATATAIRE